MFIKNFKYDYKNFILKRSYNYIIIFGIALIFCVDFLIKVNIQKIDISALSMLDVLFFIFAGIGPFKPTVSVIFRLPLIWVVFYVIIL